MKLSKFERLVSEDKTVYQITLIGDPDEPEDMIDAFKSEDEVVAQLMLNIDADGLCQAIEAYKAARSCFKAVSLAAVAQSNNFSVHQFLTVINLYWCSDLEVLYCEFETVDEYSGVVLWKGITEFFPCPLVDLPAWEADIRQGEQHG